MPRPAPRLHRLPQRLDYTLIPAPLDLSIQHMSEKSPLPAIIVTPSSPSSSHFSIAFLAPPPKPSIWGRTKSYLHNAFPPRTRTLFPLVFLFFLLLCHYLAHRLAVSRGHLDFFPIEDSVGVGAEPSETSAWFRGWFDMSALWGASNVQKGSPASILEAGIQ